MQVDRVNHPGIEGVLNPLRARQRRLNMVRWLSHGLLAGAVTACVAAPLSWGMVGGAFSQLALIAAGCVAAGGVIGAIAGLLVPIDDLKLAHAMDRASAGEDRFASALQLGGHSNRARAALVVDDALERVRGTSAAAALPARLPRNTRWIPVPLVAVALFLFLMPPPASQATGPTAPEISAEEWTAIQDEFAKELAQLPKPVSAEEEELQRELQDLAAKLGEKPDKKEALKEIARLSEKVEQQRRAMGARGMSMKNAARAMTNSQALKNFVSKLKEGAYDQAASELRKTAEQLTAGAMALDGAEFESIAADLQELAEQLSEEEALRKETESGAGAAATMNPEALAAAMKRLAEQMEKNADRMNQRDNLEKRRKMLEELKRRMNQRGECPECNGEGCEACEGNRPGFGKGKRPGMGTGMGGGKGGLKAGWGSAAKWDGGALDEEKTDNTPELADTAERPGLSTSFPIVSPEEQARSGKSYEELYAEFVHKAEADLDLENVPVAYREFLRRYFNSIRPTETAPADEKGKDGEAP